MQVSRNILCVSKYSLLTHTFYSRHHFRLGQTENVCKIVDTRLSLSILRLCDMFLRDKRLDDAHGFLHFFVVKEQRRGDALACFIHTLHGDACGIDMRHIVAALQIACLFECGDGCTHTCLNVGHGVVPTRLARNLERRAAGLHALSGHILHGLPHLLYLADAQLCLVEQNEMLVEIVVVIEHKAFGLKMRIAPCTSCLLHIVFERVGYIVMHHQSDIALVYAHSKGGSGNDNAHIIAHERLLIGYLLVRIHASVEGQSLVAVACEFLCQHLRALRARYIYYCGTI